MVGNFYINKLLERTVFLACPDSGGWMHKGRLRISQMHSEKAVKFGTSFGGDEALFKCITIANKCICIKCRIEGWELSLIHISEPTRLRRISYAVFCLTKK